MCVSQYRDYVDSYTHKPLESVSTKDRVMKNRGTYFGSGNSMWYVEDRKKLKELAEAGNVYAVEALKEECGDE